MSHRKDASFLLNCFMYFQESDLSFYFGPGWLARKYDDHHFYSRLSGAGLKAVDFITISKDNQLVFWEVKNFSRRKPALNHDPVQKIIDEKEDFVQDMSQKVKDTFRALNAIHGYYRRKWSFHPRRWSMLYLEHSRQNWYFWFKAHELAAQPESCRFILLIESDEAHRLPDVHAPIKVELQHLVQQIDVLDVQKANALDEVTIEII
jgi:hypothetical protein